MRGPSMFPFAGFFEVHFWASRWAESLFARYFGEILEDLDPADHLHFFSNSACLAPRWPRWGLQSLHALWCCMARLWWRVSALGWEGTRSHRCLVSRPSGWCLVFCVSFRRSTQIISQFIACDCFWRRKTCMQVISHFNMQWNANCHDTKGHKRKIWSVSWGLLARLNNLGGKQVPEEMLQPLGHGFYHVLCKWISWARSKGPSKWAFTILERCSLHSQVCRKMKIQKLCSFALVYC